MTPGDNVGRVRLAVVLSHPTQYYSPWFRWLAEHTPLDLRVFYLWDFGVTAQRDPSFRTAVRWDVDLLSGYAHEFVPNTAREPGTHHFHGLRNPQLTARLTAWRPDALLVFGYKWRAVLGAIVWARRHGVPLLFRGDSHFLGRGHPGWPTRTALRWLYAQFRGFLTVGHVNRDYYRVLGVPEERLFFAPHAVDRTLFDPQRPGPGAEAAALRTQLGLTPGTRVVLFAGKFIPAKQPRELLAAFLALRRPHTALVFVGDGPEKAALLAAAGDAPAGTVHFLPFANQTEMPARYLLADVFALPSRGHYETWGLAVNEALHLGVPCLVSDLVGCQRDLVEEGVTGWVCTAGDSADLQRTLGRALDTVATDAHRETLRAAAVARAARYTYPQTTDGLLAALRRILPAR
jgi:glycosyltransferase involved in cell wall biosynthesis